MSLILKTYIIGNMANNTYLLADSESKQAFLVDPAMDVAAILPEIEKDGWKIQEILLTHAHFDHTYGLYELQQHWKPLPHIALHEEDQPLYQAGGLGDLAGLHRDALPKISFWLTDDEILTLGDTLIHVYHCAGHTPGHVFFYIPALKTALVGDIIFRRGVGRTDLPGASQSDLVNNIKNKIFQLPDDTRLLSGHGPATTVAEEKRENPFLMV